MSPYQRALLTPRHEGLRSNPNEVSTHAYTMLEEFRFVRREAQAEADLAYGDWREHSSADAYAVYRAAQDRADAAQDDLAAFVATLQP